MRQLIVWVLLCLIWGSTWGVIKVGLRDLPPITFAALRFMLAASILLGIALLRRAKLPRSREEWQLLATTGILQFTVNYGLVFWSEKYISSGLASLLQATIPLFGLLLAHRYLPDEPITARKLVGIGIGLLGLGIIFSDQFKIGGAWSLWASAAMLIGAFASAYSGVLVKMKGANIDISVLVSGQMLCGLVPLIVYGFLQEGNPIQLHWTLTAIASVFYLAIVGTVVAFMLYYWLVRHMDVTKTQLISLVIPIVAVLIGVLFLNEPMTWRLVLGGAGIFIGIGLIVLRRA